MAVYCGIIKAFIARVPEQYLFKYFFLFWLQKKPINTVLVEVSPFFNTLFRNCTNLSVTNHCVQKFISGQWKVDTTFILPNDIH